MDETSCECVKLCVGDDDDYISRHGDDYISRGDDDYH